MSRKEQVLVAFPSESCFSFICSAILDMIRLEKSLDECLERLKARCNRFHVDIDLSETDDLESIASSSASLNAMSLRRSSVRFGHHSEIEKLNKKVAKLEDENKDLKKKLKELEAYMRSDADKKLDADEEKKIDGKLEVEGGKPRDISEGNVWGILRDLDRRSSKSVES